MMIPKENLVNDLRNEVGMVFQKPNPFPMSIYDDIAGWVEFSVTGGHRDCQ